MILNYFNSYFEILAGLNLGYAAFNYFRTELATKVFKINSSSEMLAGLKRRLTLLVSEDDGSGSYETYLKVNEKAKIAETKLDATEDLHRYFFEVLKPISFMLALLCLTYLIIAGFQDGVLTGEQHLYTDYIFTLTCFISVFIFTIFFSTFSLRVLKYQIRVNMQQIVLSFLILAAVSCTSINDFFALGNIGKTFMLAGIPILLYWLFIFFNVKRIENYKDRKGSQLCVCFFNLCLENFWPVLLYLVVLLSAVAFVIHYFWFSYYGFVKYLIILSTPVSLFTFIAIRVFIHTRKFGKKYKKLAEEQILILDTVLN